MKGIYNSRPSLPKYTETWDPSIVLEFLRGKFPAKSLNLKELTKKLVTLLAILTGQRTQTVHMIKLRNVNFNMGKMTITIDNLLKTSRPGHHQKPIVLQNYAPDKRLCVVTYMREYIQRTKPIRNTDWLLVSTQKPHGEISRSTISNWVRGTLKSAGINTAIYGPHSTRSASVSTAIKTVPLDELLKKVGWRSASTFQKYYNKPVVVETKMDLAILDQTERKKKAKKDHKQRR